MKSRFTKSLIAMLVLAAMLTQNAYSVYAVSVSDEIQVENQSDNNEVVVETESGNSEITVETQTSESEATPVVSEGESSSSNDQSSQDGNYDDEIMLINDESAEGSTVSEESQAEEETVGDETVESLKVLDNQISGSGLESLEVMIDTNRLNTGDTFRIIFTGAEGAQYDTRLNDTLDTTAQGIYRFIDLNKEGFNIRATSDDNVSFEFTTDNGRPVIKVVSLDSSADKNLYTKDVSSRDGKNVAALFGEGYSSAVFKLDTKELAPKAEFTVYVDSEADVTINGSSASSISCTKETKTIELSNLDKKQFTIYIVGNDGYDINSSASVNSIDDGEATFYVSGDVERVKKVYTYSDADVTVTATLQFADAVPDDAEFVVTPIKNTNAVNAYLAALNNQDEGQDYTEENTLLYDIAFLVDKTDDDGYPIAGEKVEFEPEAGSVTIDIKFNKSQLTDELGASDSSSIIVNHLPLKDSVKDGVDTTVDATDISASDVIVESVDADVDVTENGTDEIKMSVSSLSVFGVTGGTSVVTGSAVTFADVLGNAKNYGIVANEMTLGGHLESNFATGSLHGNAGIQGPKNDGKSAGTTYIGSYDGSDFKMTTNGNSGKLLIYTTYDAVNNFGFNMTGYYNGQFPRTNASPRYPDNVVVNIDKYSSSDIKNIVSGLIKSVNDNSKILMSEQNAIAFSSFPKDGANYPEIYISDKNSTAGTYYINFAVGEYKGQHLKIKINSNQTVVLNIPDSSVEFGQYEISIDGKNYTTSGSSDEDIVCQHVIFNCPNATSAKTKGPVDGTFICPNAEFVTDSVAAGWLVCDNASRIGGNEWHFVYRGLEEPNSGSFTVGVKKQVPSENDKDQQFTFKLYKTSNNLKVSGSGADAELLDTIVLNGGIEGAEPSKTFKTINYNNIDFGGSNEKKFYYVIVEELTDEQKKTWESGTYYSYAHIIVTVTKDYNVTAEYVYNDENLNSKRPSYDGAGFDASLNANQLSSNGNILFINSKKTENGKAELKVTKKLVGTGTDSIGDKKFKFKIESLKNITIAPHTFGNDTKDFPNSYVEVAPNDKDNNIKSFGTLEFPYSSEDKVYAYKVYEVHPDNLELVDKTFSDGTSGTSGKYYYDATTGIYYDASVYIVKLFVNNIYENGLKRVQTIFKVKKYYEIGGEYYSAKENVELSVDNNITCADLLTPIEFVNGCEPKGKVIVKKVTEGAFDGDENFYFEIQTDGEPYTRLVPENLSKDGDNGYKCDASLETGWEHSKHLFTIKSGETITINNVPTGNYSIIEYIDNKNCGDSKYQVSENDYSIAGYVVDYSGTNDISISSAGNTVNKVLKNIKDSKDYIEINGKKLISPKDTYSISNDEFKFKLSVDPLTPGAPWPENATDNDKKNGYIVSNDGNGIFDFGKIWFSNKDAGNTYTYIISECLDTSQLNYFKDNDEVYRVTVTVGYDENNNIKVDKKITKDGEDSEKESITFTNSYYCEIPFEFTAKKTISGRDLSEKEFEFVLKAINQEALTKKINGLTEVSKKNTLGDGYKEELVYFNRDGNNATPVKFDQNDIDKTFEYEIYEVIPSDAEQVKDNNGNVVSYVKNGVTYDSEHYIITVVPKFDDTTKSMYFETSVKKNSKGESQSVSGNVVEVGFNNTYNTKGKASLTFTKSVVGNMPEGKTFTFTLYDAKTNEKIDSKDFTYPNATSVTFSGEDFDNHKLSFTEAHAGQTFEYYCVEEHPNGAVKDENGNYVYEGITYDSTRHDCTIEVNDNKGNLSFVTKYDGNIATSVNFENKYDSKSGNATIAGKKSIIGKSIAAGDYTFVLSAVDGAPMPKNDNGETVTDATVDADGKFEFNEITYSLPGIYKYKVSEEKGDIAGVTYTSDVFDVEIKIEDNGSGQLVVPDGYPKYLKNNAAVEEMVFNNTYNANGSTKIRGNKRVVVRNNPNESIQVKGGQFYFGLYTTDSKGNKVLCDTKSNNESGYFEFDLSYTLDDLKDPDGKIQSSKTFTYYVHELGKDELKELKYNPQPGYTYDDNYYEVKVYVSDNGSGVLSVSNTTDSTPVDVVNSYYAEGTAEIYGLKILLGREINSNDTFTFDLYADSNNKNDDRNISNKNNNPYYVDTITVKGDSLTKDGNIAFKFEKKLSYYATGEYVYYVKEVVPQDKNGIVYDTEPKKVTVKVTDNSHEGTLECSVTPGTVGTPVTFINKVPNNDSKNILAYKVSKGKELKAGDFEFTISELNSENKYVQIGKPKTTAGAAAGEKALVQFDKIAYDINDVGLHVYEIAEVIPNDNKKIKGYTYDDTKFYAAVDVSYDAENNKLSVTDPIYYKGSVSDNNKVSDAGVVFENIYSGKTEITLGGRKYLYSDENKKNSVSLTKGQFTFELYEKGDKEPIRTASNDNDGFFDFAPIEYTSEKYLTKDYKVSDNLYRVEYTIKEKIDNANVEGITYDDTTYDVVVDLYVDDSGELKAKKGVYTRADSTNGTNDGLGDRIINFFTRNEDGIVFRNVINAEAKLKLGVTKSLLGMSWDDSNATFDFVLKEGSKPIVQALNSKEYITVDKDSVNHVEYFDEITYTIGDLYSGIYNGERTYTYTVSELIPEKILPGVKYSENTYTVEVVVTDTHDGKLSIVATVTDKIKEGSRKYSNSDTINVCEPECFMFINSYIPVETEVSIRGIKDLTGKQIAKGQFSFELKAKTEGAPLPTTTVVSNGNVDNGDDKTFEFGPIKFDDKTPGLLNEYSVFRDSVDYVYEVSEVIPLGATEITKDGKVIAYKLDGITYDITPKKVTITVTNNKGVLNAEVKYEQAEGLHFVNPYDADGEWTLSVMKVVDGLSSEDTSKSFDFILESLTESDPNRAGKTGEKVQIGETVSAVNMQTVDFTKLKYTVQDTITASKAQNRNDNTAEYKYVVYELNPGTEDGYIYSKQVYTATVTVSVNEVTGKLDISSTIIETTDYNGNPSSSTESCKLPVFTNVYNAKGETTLPVIKRLEGRNIKQDEFAFCLRDESGENILEEYTTNLAVLDSKQGYAEDTIAFGTKAFKYTMDSLQEGNKHLDNKIFYYTIEEEIPKDPDASITYDDGFYVVAVIVSNNGDGTLKVDKVFQRFEGERSSAISSMKDLVKKSMDVTTQSFDKNVEDLLKSTSFASSVVFNNEYAATGKWDPTGKKILTGKPLVSNTFKFVLEELDGDGKNAKLISKDHVAVTYNGEGTDPEKVVFDENSIWFLKYSLKDVGLHYYRITESVPDEAKKDANGNYVYKGITYDSKEWLFHVTVEDNGDGTLKVTCPEKTDTGDVYFTFNNHYNANTFIDLYGVKAMEGRDLDSSDKYTFGIREVTSGAKDTTEYTVENNGSAIEFIHGTSLPILNYDVTDTDVSAIGTHKYEIREIAKSGDGITYDKSVYTVSVNVAYNEDGTLSASVDKVTYSLNGGIANAKYDFSDVRGKEHHFSFTNKFEAKAELQFKGIKHLRRAENAADFVNAADLDDKFTFSIYEYPSVDSRTAGTSGKLVGTTKSDAYGNYTLSGPKFTQDDLKETDGTKTGYKDSIEKYYQLIETKPSSGTWKDGVFTGSDGVIYDNRVYNIDVTVSAAAAGSDTLSVKATNHDTGAAITVVSGSENMYTVGSFDFTNIKPEFTSISGTKTWNDRGISPSDRPDVYIDLHSSVDGYASVLATYVIHAPATTYEFTKLPVVDSSGNRITYTVTERAISGYFTEQVGYNFINTSGDILIRKVDSDTGLPLDGATLAILNSAGTEVERWTSSASAHVVEADLTKGATYTLHEVSAPTGYGLAADMSFTVPTDGSEIVVTMADPKITARVRLRKLDADTREALSGAEFALYNSEGTRIYASGAAGSYTYSSSSSNGRFAVNGAGELLITGLPYGTYYFRETVAPSGYGLSTESIGFTVLEDGATYDVTCLDPKERGSVRLRKTNASGTVSLAGAVFELYAKTPSTISSAVASTIYGGSYYRVGSYTTDASGMIYVGDLPWDDYYFIEVTAPAGYTVRTDVTGDSLVYSFTVGAGSTDTVSYDLGRIVNPTSGGGGGGGTVLGERTDDGRREGGVLSGVLGVRAAPKQGVLGERVGPVTGDASSIILWMLLLIVSIAAIVSVAVINAKRKKLAKVQAR